MSLFLRPDDKQRIELLWRQSPAAEGLYWGLLNRAMERASAPLLGASDTEWWYHAAEFLSDGAMALALKPAAPLAAWLRSTILAIVRRPIDDWVGPYFRDHDADPPIGHLETAHLGWGVALAVDLAPDIFTREEREEIFDVLRKHCIALCLRWLDGNPIVANWHCVMTAGVALPAAVMGDEDALKRAKHEFQKGQDIFQPDGSYAESLQYGNYAAYAQMLTWESLVRHDPKLSTSLSLDPYARMPSWQAASLFYRKPMSGWGSQPVPRSANFNDSSAIFRPSADLLLHIAVRCRDHAPVEAGLARWLFDQLYCPFVEQAPHDRATFGLVNDFGFLTIPLLPLACDPITPEEAGIPLACGFSCGDMIARDNWQGRTVLAVHGAGEPLHGPGHLHADLNSFILVHNRERLLADPGHTCYRTLVQRLIATSSQTHNLCTFAAEPGPDQPKTAPIEQDKSLRRYFNSSTREAQPPVVRGGKRLLLSRLDDVTAMGSEVAAVYGEPIQEFSRFWLLCGSHVLFVVDHIRSSRPVKTTWNWLLNNRDGQLQMKTFRPDRIVARRGEAGMKLFHMAGGKMHGPTYAHIHDAYHPLPAKLGHGSPGTGTLMHWTEKNALAERIAVHAICMDHYGTIAGWHLKSEEGYAVVLDGPRGSQKWKLRIQGEELIAEEAIHGRTYSVKPDKNAAWKLTRI